MVDAQPLASAHIEQLGRWIPVHVIVFFHARELLHDLAFGGEDIQHARCTACNEDAMAYLIDDQCRIAVHVRSSPGCEELPRSEVVNAKLLLVPDVAVK